jgi:hypothetical protein
MSANVAPLAICVGLITFFLLGFAAILIADHFDSRHAR